MGVVPALCRGRAEPSPCRENWFVPSMAAGVKADDMGGFAADTCRYTHTLQKGL